VLESGKGWLPTEQGTPQGAIISPLLANIYLDPLDQHMAKRGWRMIRYADDFVVQCHTEAEAQEALAEIRNWMGEAGLTLHPEKTKIVDARQRGGFDFLGWHFERGLKWPREKSQRRFKEAIRKETPRSSGRSLERIIQKVNRITKGWGNYFKGGVDNVAEKLTDWTRMRLRSILRCRERRKGRGRGLDHHRYMNDWFAEKGLIFLHMMTHPDSKQSLKAKLEVALRHLRQGGGNR
jgi:RNA-directed DNA polymerase